MVGMLVEHRETLFAYLTAFDFVASTLVGGLFLLLVINAWRATWPVAFRRLLEAPLGGMAVLLVLFIPIALELGTLYSWVHPERIADPAERQVVALKLNYLKPHFFIGRAYLYLGLFWLLSELLRGRSLLQDGSTVDLSSSFLKRLSGPLLLPFFLAATFASFDWICSLLPSWSSAIFGFYWLAGGVVGALSLLTLCVRAVEVRGLIPIDRSHYYALGRCLFTAVAVWAYFAFFQFFLIWIANKPDEARWFVIRASSGWAGASMVIIVLAHFALPFVVLLPYAARRSPTVLTVMAVWLLLVHYFDGFWCIAPTLHPARFHFSWQDALMVPFVAGLTGLLALLRLRGRAVAAWNDPLYLAALEYRSR